MTKQKLRVGDLVRVRQSGGGLGPTLYVLDWIGERGYCCIREAGKPLAGAQEFDLSLLQKIPDNPADDPGVKAIKSGKIKEGPALLSRLLPRVG